MSAFTDVQPLPPDPILGLNAAFRNDPRDNKINLGVGAYKSAEGDPVVLSAVQKAETRIVEAQLNKEYPPITGEAEFIRLLTSLAFTPDSAPLKENRIFGTQSVGGTGALCVGIEFLHRNGKGPIYISDPSWPNHKTLCQKVGISAKSYPYYDSTTGTLDFENMHAAISKIPAGGVVILQASCHNPTGVEPSPDQWRILSKTIKERGIIPFFDLAYLGFGQGFDKDAFAVRLFAEEGHEMFVAISCSKNFGLYGERVGMLAVIAETEAIAQTIGTHCKGIIRGIYSMPPRHGARIVQTILDDDALKKEWEDELATMRQRIQQMRSSLIQSLETSGAGDQFSFMASQQGMFSYTGLSADHVARLQKDHGIFMPKSGRVNVAGLVPTAIDTIAKAIVTVIKER